MVKKLYTFLMIVGLSINSFAQVEKGTELYKTIVGLDAVLFEAYNNCEDPKKLEKHASFYAEDIEFFHDIGGLETSKKDLILAIEKNICGRVNRELVEGSMEMYEIPNYGIVAIGYHKFRNLIEKSVSQPSKFIVFWRQKNDDWEISKVVSLH